MDLTFGMQGDIADIVTHANFLTIGSAVSEFWYPRVLPFFIGLAGHPYNSVTV